MSSRKRKHSSSSSSSSSSKRRPERQVTTNDEEEEEEDDECPLPPEIIHMILSYCASDANTLLAWRQVSTVYRDVVEGLMRGWGTVDVRAQGKLAWLETAKVLVQHDISAAVEGQREFYRTLRERIIAYAHQATIHELFELWQTPERYCGLCNFEYRNNNDAVLWKFETFSPIDRPDRGIFLPLNQFPRIAYFPKLDPNADLDHHPLPTVPRHGTRIVEINNDGGGGGTRIMQINNNGGGGGGNWQINTPLFPAPHDDPAERIRNTMAREFDAAQRRRDAERRRQDAERRRQDAERRRQDAERRRQQTTQMQMRPHNEQMRQHIEQMRQHDEEMRQHEEQMRQHDEEMRRLFHEQ